MEKGGKPSKQFVACSIFNSFSAWHKDECQTTEETNRGWQRGMEKRKRALRWEWRRPRGNFPSKEFWETHAYTHCNTGCMCKNIYFTKTAWVDKICTWYMWHIWAWRCTQAHTCSMNILQPGTEEREEGVWVAKEWVKQKERRKERTWFYHNLSSGIFKQTHARTPWGHNQQNEASWGLTSLVAFSASVHDCQLVRSPSTTMQPLP